jgi:adenine-specific DNA methylase
LSGCEYIEDLLSYYFRILYLCRIKELQNDRVYLGDNGIKINNEFIPKENILSYYMIEGRVNQFELFIKGKENLIRFTINKRTMERPIDEVLDEWKK